MTTLPRRLRRAALFVALVMIAVVMLYPLVFMVQTSLRSTSQYQSGVGYSLESWAQLFHDLPIARQLANSTLVCLGALAVILAVASSAGFAFAKLRFRGSGPVMAGIVSCAMVPMQSIILPEYVNLAGLNLVNTYAGAILVYAALGTPFATFLMTVYFRNLPDELIEAAVMDGLSYARAFVRIALPMALPAIATVVVLQFIQIWCDLLVGLLFLQTPELRTVTTGLAVLAAGRVTSIPVLMAGATLSAVPAVVVYLLLQRHFTRGLTVGISK
jgi:ABC-type glycerol-3-phosphate transport system permease component